MPTNLSKVLVLLTSLAAIFGLIFTQKHLSTPLLITDQTNVDVAASNVGSQVVEVSLEADASLPIDRESFAVVELFTSQGCSSCPPADQVLRKLIEKGQKTKKQIYGLSFHVDYWNYLGWKDPYSHPDFSDRQRAYNQRLKSRGSYTPQMIVNGVSEFVGSKDRYANQEVSYALGKSAKVAIKITNLQLDKAKNKVKFEYQTIGECKNCKLNIAAVESNLVDAVKRGENHGRTLQHDNVVRAFKTVDFEVSNKQQLTLPKGMNFAESAVIVYVQEENHGRIVGAANQDLQ